MGPGWGQSATPTRRREVLGGLSIADLWQAGYNVLTWDPRWFGHSTGGAEVDSPSDEGQDVAAMINWVAPQPGVELGRRRRPDGHGRRIVRRRHPIRGGRSDCRIDAIVPTIAWHSLVTSLDKNQTPKAGWGNILERVASTARLDPEIPAADREMNTTGVIDAEPPPSSRMRAARSSRVKVPTLILQGTVDDLFTLDEGIANYETLHGQEPLSRWPGSVEGTGLPDRPGVSDRVVLSR